MGGYAAELCAGSSDPSDGVVDTLFAGAGVCRDFAHQVVALLRAVNVPARVVSVYAPGACTPWTSTRSPRRSSRGARG